jgi:hypothetical protein
MVVQAEKEALDVKVPEDTTASQDGREVLLEVLVRSFMASQAGKALLLEVLVGF